VPSDTGSSCPRLHENQPGKSSYAQAQIRRLYLFTYWWVTIKLAIVLVLTGAVLFVLVQGSKPPPTR
jgi:hypothetical protein